MQKFVLFRINAQFRANLVVLIDVKMMQNFVQKNHFVQKHETVAQENLLFCGNPINKSLLWIIVYIIFWFLKRFKGLKGTVVNLNWTSLNGRSPDSTPYSPLNPIPAGVLENQDTQGGWGKFAPPPALNPMFDVQIWQMIHHGKALLQSVQSVSLCHRLSKKLNVIKIWQLKVGQNEDLVCYRKKQLFKQCAWGLRQLV